jgi:hypothetical protein
MKVMDMIRHILTPKDPHLHMRKGGTNRQSDLCGWKEFGGHRERPPPPKAWNALSIPSPEEDITKEAIDKVREEVRHIVDDADWELLDGLGYVQTEADNADTSEPLFRMTAVAAPNGYCFLTVPAVSTEGVVDRIAVAMHKSLVEQDVHGYLAAKIDAGILARVAVDVITGRHTRSHTGDTHQDMQQGQED